MWLFINYYQLINYFKTSAETHTPRIALQRLLRICDHEQFKLVITQLPTAVGSFKQLQNDN